MQNNSIVEFVKKNLLISSLISLIAALVYYLLMLEPNNWIGAVAAFFIAFGALTLCILSFGVFFPKIAIKDYKEDCDPSEYVTVYFYDRYQNGFARVIKLHGDPDDVESMHNMVSFIDENGEFITDKWFETAGEFENNRAVVCIEDYQFNIINEKGELICKQNYPGMALEVSDGKVKVSDGEGNVNFIDVETGKEIWKSWKKEMSV